MSRFLQVVCVVLAGLCLGASKAPPPTFTSYAQEFEAFADETAALPTAERVALFRQRFSRVFPAFYAERWRDPAAYDKQIGRALERFPELRERYDSAVRDFGQAFTTGQARFRRTFPDYELNVPVYLLHSLGEMDGGMRTLDGKGVMIFGADVIARVHDGSTIGPFLDHELFHIYHKRAFSDCGQGWCGFWIEGLAVYAASRMTPGATDRQLLLTEPRPIRPEVEPRLREAMCLARAKFESTDEAELAPFFSGNLTAGWLPPRSGYLLGYLLAEKIGRTVPLAKLAKLPPDKVKPLLLAAADSYGPCPVA